MSKKLIMDFTQENIGEDQFTDQLLLTIPLGLPYELKVVCRSEFRSVTSFETFDQLGDSMGRRSFSCHGLEGPILGQFARNLIDDLNILLEEFGIQLNFPKLLPIAKLAVGKCESLFGDGAEDGDCIIVLH